MAGYMSTKMKRKDLEDVYDDFSDFSLSSPARKIRRLDAELPPIMEEDEAGVGLNLNLNLNSVSQGDELPTVVPETEQDPVNEERALVLYKPINSLLTNPFTSSGVSITVNQDLISGFKNGSFWSVNSELFKSQDQLESTDEKGEGNNCLAVVPWVSYPFASAPSGDVSTVVDTSEPMEADDVECGTMEIEDDGSVRMSGDQTVVVNGSGEVLQQWQQQHCMTPQLPPNTAATPVMWSW